MSGLIVITGNPLTGFDYTGPFENGTDAVEFAEQAGGDEWWTAELLPPPETEPMTLNEGIAALRRLAQRYEVPR